MGVGKQGRRNRRRALAARIEARNRLQQMKLHQRIGYDKGEYWIRYYKN
jgi:hypothetical protein